MDAAQNVCGDTDKVKVDISAVTTAKARTSLTDGTCKTIAADQCRDATTDVWDAGVASGGRKGRAGNGAAEN